MSAITIIVIHLYHDNHNVVYHDNTSVKLAFTVQVCHFLISIFLPKYHTYSDYWFKPALTPL